MRLTIVSEPWRSIVTTGSRRRGRPSARRTHARDRTSTQTNDWRGPSAHRRRGRDWSIHPGEMAVPSQWRCGKRARRGDWMLLDLQGADDDCLTVVVPKVSHAHATQVVRFKRWCRIKSALLIYILAIGTKGRPLETIALPCPSPS